MLWLASSNSGQKYFFPLLTDFGGLKKKKKAKGEIFGEIFLQADVCLCFITLRISMALVKN